MIFLNCPKAIVDERQGERRLRKSRRHRSADHCGVGQKKPRGLWDVALRCGVSKYTISKYGGMNLNEAQEEMLRDEDTLLKKLVAALKARQRI